MTTNVRSAACLTLLACALSAGTGPARAAPAARAMPHNGAGQPLVDTQGRPINYSQRQWRQARAAPSHPRAARASESAAATSAIAATWSYAMLGDGIGLPGIATATNGTAHEVYTGNTSYWYALSWNAKRKSLDQVYVSTPMRTPIIRIVVQHALSGDKIVVGLADGYTVGYDQKTKRALWSRPGACAASGGMTAMTSADLNADGNDEIIGVCADQSLAVHDAQGNDWTVNGVSGTDIVVAQMDDDSGPEIATSGGQVIDVATRAIQWNRGEGFGSHLQATDLDGDGRAELIAAEPWYRVWAYDVEKQLPKWSLSTSHDIAAIAVADVNGDGSNELLVADGQWGAVHVYNPSTLAELGSITNPEHGVTSVVVADLGGTGAAQVLWGAGASSSGPDHLYVANWSDRSIVWQNPDLRGPFVGPVMGDLDGDGEPELVVASYSSEAGYNSGRILVFNARTRALRAISAGVADEGYAWTGVHAIELRDIDGDGKLEIVVATDYLYDGLIEAYKFSASNEFTRVWRNATRPFGSPFYSVDVADVDGDGKLEVLGGVGYAHSGSQGQFVYAYDAVTGAEKWHTLHTGATIQDLRVADVNGDGKPEVVSQIDGTGLYVFDGHGQLLAIEALVSTSLTLWPDSAVTKLLVGQTDGSASVRQFDGVRFPEVSSVALGSKPIDGITVADSGAWWVGSAGALRRYRGGVVDFTSKAYGTGFGQRVASKPGSSWIYSAGSYGLHGFNLGR